MVFQINIGFWFLDSISFQPSSSHQSPSDSIPSSPNYSPLRPPLDQIRANSIANPILKYFRKLPRKIFTVLSNLPLAIGEMFAIVALMALDAKSIISHLPHFKAVNMDKICFCDLEFRLGAGYRYCHQLLQLQKVSSLLSDEALLHPIAFHTFQALSVYFDVEQVIGDQLVRAARRPMFAEDPQLMIENRTVENQPVEDLSYSKFTWIIKKFSKFIDIILKCSQRVHIHGAS